MQIHTNLISVLRTIQWSGVDNLWCAGFPKLASTRHKSPAASCICTRYFLVRKFIKYVQSTRKWECTSMQTDFQDFPGLTPCLPGAWVGDTLQHIPQMATHYCDLVVQTVYFPVPSCYFSSNLKSWMCTVSCWWIHKHNDTLLFRFRNSQFLHLCRERRCVFTCSCGGGWRKFERYMYCISWNESLDTM